MFYKELYISIKALIVCVCVLLFSSCNRSSESQLILEKEQLLRDYNEKVRRIKEIERKIDSIVEHDEKAYKMANGIPDSVDLSGSLQELK